MKSPVKIPTEFQLGCHIIKVEIIEEFEDHTSGESREYNDEIIITKRSNDIIINPLVMRTTFYHELVHMILNKLGYTELSDNESFIQSFGLMLEQFDETKKF